jgi:DNA topoisomerase I
VRGYLAERVAEDAADSARHVGLRYVSDQMPGISREREGTVFRYRYATGDIVDSPEVLGRIRSLAIPPAWKDVWICPDPEGHLQATGRDARGRKQYRYHPRWREVREETKFARMLAFGMALDAIRARVAKDLALRQFTRQKVLATVVRLLEVSLIRVGNEEYERENASFGLTTMKNRHVDVHGSEICFHFRGKGGKQHRIDVHDRRLAQIVRKCQDLPGQELFQYLDESNHLQDVKSTDVNEYLREITGEDFTAKDFRTWAGTVLAALALQDFKAIKSKAQAKKHIVSAIESVASRLGNTPSVCKKCYVHPRVLEGYLDGTLATALNRWAHRAPRRWRHLRAEEAAVLALLQRRAARQERQESNPFAN